MIHHVFANKSNVGDWLSARGIQSLLAPCGVTEHFCDRPFVEATLERLSDAPAGDLIVIGGGGLFMDYFTPFWEGFGELAGRVSFCLWGVGCCDLKREPSHAPQALLRKIVQHSLVCIARDELTRRYVGGELPPPVPCPSLCAIEAPMTAGHGVLHVDNYTTAGADVYEMMEECGRRFARGTGRPFRKTNNRIAAASEVELAGTLALYTQCDLILSSALHGCVLGVALGRKVLAVSGDYKIDSFMHAAGLGDWVCDIRDLEALPDRLECLPGQPCCQEFLVRARRANSDVAQRVRSLAKSQATCSETELNGGSDAVRPPRFHSEEADTYDRRSQSAP